MTTKSWFNLIVISNNHHYIHYTWYIVQIAERIYHHQNSMIILGINFIFYWILNFNSTGVYIYLTLMYIYSIHIYVNSYIVLGVRRVVILCEKNSSLEFLFYASYILKPLSLWCIYVNDDPHFYEVKKYYYNFLMIIWIFHISIESVYRLVLFFFS